MADRLAGKVALVTGAASGIGRACAEVMAQEGAHVWVTDIDAAAAQAVAQHICQLTPSRAVARRLDVTNEAEWQACAAAVQQANGRLDVLVNNAGIGALGTVEEVSHQQWQYVMDVNVGSVFLGCRTMLPLMRHGRGASVVNISSVSGIVAAGNLAAYNASKAAVRHLSKSVALMPQNLTAGVRCNSVHPAFVDTPQLEPLIERHGGVVKDKLSRQVPLGRLGTTREVALGVVFLASDESTFMTATELVLDGGLSAQ